MHKTKTEFDNHLTFKVFLFEFVNTFSSLFYIAFIKGKFTGYPGHYNSIFGIRLEDVHSTYFLSDQFTDIHILFNISVRTEDV